MFHSINNKNAALLPPCSFAAALYRTSCLYNSTTLLPCISELLFEFTELAPQCPAISGSKPTTSSLSLNRTSSWLSQVEVTLRIFSLKRQAEKQCSLIYYKRKTL